MPLPEIPLHDPRRVVDTADVREAISGVLAAGRYIDAEHVAGFERAFAQFLGLTHCVGVGNGTDALEIALRAVGVVTGDRILTVANAGFYATSAILACGARPVFIDVEQDSMLMSTQGLREALRTGPAAVVHTPLYGDLSQSPHVMGLCAAARVPVVVDGAHAPDPRAVTGATAAAFSFYPTKNLPAAGDGGAVASDDPSVARLARQLARYGWSTRFQVQRPGRNSRLDEMQAAVLLHGLGRLRQRTARRADIRRAYATALSGSAWRIVGDADAHVAHLSVVQGPEMSVARQVFAAHGVATDVHYPCPDHQQPGLPGGVPATLPVTESLVGSHLSIPCFPELGDGEVARVLEALGELASRV